MSRLILTSDTNDLSIVPNPQQDTLVLGFHFGVLSTKNYLGVITPIAAVGNTGPTGATGVGIDGADGGNLLRWRYGAPGTSGQFNHSSNWQTSTTLDTLTFNINSLDQMTTNSKPWFDLLKVGVDLNNDNVISPAIIKAVDKTNPNNFVIFRVFEVNVTNTNATIKVRTLLSSGPSVPNLTYNISWVFLGKTGATGPTGGTGSTGSTGATGPTGNSAYQDAVASGSFTGTLQEWLDSLIGPTGPTGAPGVDDDFSHYMPISTTFNGTHHEFDIDYGIIPNILNIKNPSVTVLNPLYNPVMCGITYDIINKKVKLKFSKSFTGWALLN